MTIVKIFVTVWLEIEASGKEADNHKYEEAFVILKSLVTISRKLQLGRARILESLVTITSHKLQLGRACLRVVLLLKGLDGGSKAGPESAM